MECHPKQYIAALMGEGFVDRSTNQPLHIPVRSVLIEPGLAGDADLLLKQLGLGNKLAVVSDTVTHAVLGSHIEQTLGKDAISIILNEPKANMATVSLVRAAASKAEALVAVGSGTVNDICKYASMLDNKPYVIFGTAPSMNGYGSANAAITIGGHKKSLAAHLPLAIFLDIAVLAAAPKRLIQSGLGDTLCRSTAQADWLLSHKLIGTAYSETPFALIAPFEETLCNNAANLVKGDKELITLLAGVLVLSGFGMVLAGGSYPASQGEHMIAHTMEMVYGDKMPASFHGEQIGVTTLTMAALQWRVMNEKPPLKMRTVNNAVITDYYGAEVGKDCVQEMHSKLLLPAMIDRINQYDDKFWQDIATVMQPEQMLLRALTAAGNPVAATALGWGEQDYRDAVQHAVYSRNRFTFLDMAWYSGLI